MQKLVKIENKNVKTREKRKEKGEKKGKKRKKENRLTEQNCGWGEFWKILENSGKFWKIRENSGK